MVTKTVNPDPNNRDRLRPEPAKSQSVEARGGWNSPRVRMIGFGVLAIAMAFFIMNAIFGDNGWMVYRRQQNQLRALKEQVNKLQKENRDLEKQIQGLQSDPKVIDRLAHDQLHLVKPNQTIYTLPDSDAKADPKREAGGAPAVIAPAKP